MRSMFLALFGVAVWLALAASPSPTSGPRPSGGLASKLPFVIGVLLIFAVVAYQRRRLDRYARSFEPDGGDGDEEDDERDDDRG